MPINLFNDPLASIKLGANDILKGYVGNNQIFPNNPLVTSFTSTNTTVNGSLDAIYGFGYNVNDGYLYTLDNRTVGDYRVLVKRNATTGAYISTGGVFSPSVTPGHNLTNFAIDSGGNFWFMFRGASNSKVRKYDFNGNYLNVEHTIATVYCDGVAIDTSQAIDVIYAAGNTALMSNTIYKINTNGGGAGSISIQNGSNSDQIMYCSPSVMMRVFSQGSLAGNMYKFNLDTNQAIGSFAAYNMGNQGGAYNPVDKIAWISNYGSINSMRKFTANF
jgi:hypothetical protein|tara:strand:+ start:69 stop:893 length:825 start_codon:yes stop_codon:yes gene_type:complete